MYFKGFPSLFYEFKVGDRQELRVLTDITANVRLRKEILDAITVYETYDIKDGETAEIISAKYYGTPEYHWAIMLANEKYDYQADFPMSTQVLHEYIILKYNRFEASTWSYEVVTKNNVTNTFVTATISNHGIALDYDDTVSVDNVYVTQTNAAGLTSLEAVTGLSGDLVVTDVTEDTITFRVSGALTGVPSGGLVLYTKNRDQLIHHYELNGYTVMPDTIDAVGVTFYDYETSLNDAKRRIKLITPGMMASIGDELKNLIG